MKTSLESRGYIRVPFLCRVAVKAGGGDAWEASTVDVSLGGVGLISPRPLAVGTPIKLAFHLTNPSKPAVVEQVEGRVAYVRSDVDGHALGVEFPEPIHRSRTPELARRIDRL